LQIRSRDEVIRALDKICEYYQRSEPSSPLPLMLERAKRLVPLGFLELIRDLAPDAVAQAEALRGGYQSEE
jgi:type VI secretion system protein ImpA